MSQQSIHHNSSRSVVVPFSWEAKPGVSKLDPDHMITTTTTTTTRSHEEEEMKTMKGHYIDGRLISPPPFRFPESPKVSGYHGLYNILPLPPCLFQSTSPLPLPPSNSSRVSMMRREGDPFLAAYLECTKSSTSVKELSKRGRRKRRGCGFIKGLSCKHADGGGVREDAIVSSG